MKGVLQGMGEGAGELASPFISKQYIHKQYRIFKEGRTRDGRQIFTDTQLKTEPGTAKKCISRGESLIPFL